MKAIDEALNNTTMYRLILYFLTLLVLVGLMYSVFGILPFDPINYIFSFTFILVVAGFANYIFARVFEAPVNIESWIISSLILGLIIAPPKSIHEVTVIGWAAILMIASKFILAIYKKHIFNPVAISVAITAFAIKGTANWWVGVPSMLPVVAIGGFLIIRKIRRWDLILSFLIAVLFVTSPARWVRLVSGTPLIFFATIMLSEPLTTPPTRILRIVYGILVGVLISPQFHIGNFYTTPEISLIIGNIFSYIVSPKYKLILSLKQKLQLSHDTYDFIFTLDKPIKFNPGQYMEFTFSHPGPDSRGVRRYLSLASSPTENEIRLGVKFGNPPSSFKKELLKISPNQKISAGQLIGDFVLPKNINKKLVLMAGGIGITPYRSMIKYLTDKGEKRDIVVIYCARHESDFVYKDVLTKAHELLRIRTYFIPTSISGHINSEKIASIVPDYKERIFYISGSHGVVTAFESIVKKLGIAKKQIVTDYFPGFT